MRKTSRPILTVLLCCVAAGCGGGDAPAPSSSASADATATPDLVRTANPDLRGYGEDVFPRIQEVAPGVYTYEQLRSAGDERFTTVSLFIVTGDGVVVADGQGSVEETQRMLDQIATVTDEAVRTVIVCSDHGDHTAGNSAFPDSVTFVAHPTSIATLQTQAQSPARSADAAPIPVPTEAVENSATIRMGDKVIQVLFLGRAHTGGDLSVYLPEEKVLFMSEAYLHRVFPAMRTAYPSEWVEMIERAQEMDVDVYVPGHGFVDSPAVLEEELETYRQALVTVIDEARRLHAQGLSLEEAQAQAAFGDLEEWSLRSSQGPRSIQQVYSELNGELPSGAR